MQILGGRQTKDNNLYPPEPSYYLKSHQSERRCSNFFAMSMRLNYVDKESLHHGKADYSPKRPCILKDLGEKNNSQKNRSG